MRMYAVLRPLVAVSQSYSSAISSKSELQQSYREDSSVVSSMLVIMKQLLVMV